MFNFFALPGEIRNQIYDNLVTSPKPVSIRRPRSTDNDDCGNGQPPNASASSHTHTNPKSSLCSTKSKTTNGLSLTILLTCKALHQEARSRFFHCNTFDFATPDVLADWLQAIAFTGRKQLRSIILHHQCAIYNQSGLAFPSRQSLARALMMLGWSQRLEYFGLAIEGYVPWYTRFVPLPPSPVTTTITPGAVGEGEARGQWRMYAKRLTDLPAVAELRGLQGRKGMQIEFLFERELIVPGTTNVDALIRSCSIYAKNFLRWDGFKLVYRYGGK